MAKQSIKKYNSKRNKKYSRKKINIIVKGIKNKKIRRKGGTKNNDNDNVICSMCETNVNKKDTLVPRVCLNEHGRKAHRICSECWWNPDTGFARENTKHGCPGCEKNIPLTKVTNLPTSNQPVKVIDLTED